MTTSGSVVQLPQPPRASGLMDSGRRSRADEPGPSRRCGQLRQRRERRSLPTRRLERDLKRYPAGPLVLLLLLAVLLPACTTQKHLRSGRDALTVGDPLAARHHFEEALLRKPRLANNATVAHADATREGARPDLGLKHDPLDLLSEAELAERLRQSLAKKLARQLIHHSIETRRHALLATNTPESRIAAAVLLAALSAKRSEADLNAEPLPGFDSTP